MSSDKYSDKYSGDRVPLVGCDNVTANILKLRQQLVKNNNLSINDFIDADVCVWDDLKSHSGETIRHTIFNSVWDITITLLPFHSILYFNHNDLTFNSLSKLIVSHYIESGLSVIESEKKLVNEDFLLNCERYDETKKQWVPVVIVV